MNIVTEGIFGQGGGMNEKTQNVSIPGFFIEG